MNFSNSFNFLNIITFMWLTGPLGGHLKTAIGPAFCSGHTPGIHNSCLSKEYLRLTKFLGLLSMRLNVKRGTLIDFLINYRYVLTMLFFYLIFTHFLFDKSHFRWEIWGSEIKLSYLFQGQIQWWYQETNLSDLFHSLYFLCLKCE